MIETEVTFTVAAPLVRGHVHGPTPKGSMKCIGARGPVKHQLVEDHRPGQKQWRKAIVAAAAGLHLHAEEYEPVAVDATFTIPRPGIHYGTGRNSDRLKPNAPVFPTNAATNDTDKMFRLLADALQDAGVLVNDAQIVQLVARKAYVGCVLTPGALPRPGATIRILPVRVTADLALLEL